MSLLSLDGLLKGPSESVLCASKLPQHQFLLATCAKARFGHPYYVIWASSLNKPEIYNSFKASDTE